MKMTVTKKPTKVVKMIKIDKILCLYSGGFDSTLAAYFAAKKAKVIYLITYERFGLFSSKRAVYNLLRLKKRFSHTKFIHKIVNFEREYRNISYNNFFSDLLNFGFITLSVCGLCKLAMHWKTIKLCKNYDLDVVYDGSNKTSEIFPAQNKYILLDALKGLYGEHSITYENPAYNLDTQKILFKEKMIPSDRLKGTIKDIQPFCSQQLLFARFANYYLNKYSFKKYEQKVKKYYDQKITYVKKQLENV